MYHRDTITIETREALRITRRTLEVLRAMADEIAVDVDATCVERQRGHLDGKALARVIKRVGATESGLEDVGGAHGADAGRGSTSQGDRRHEQDGNGPG